MSTHAAIIARQPDGSYRGIYCHHDGYLAHAGAILSTHYTDQAKVDALIALGDISCLGHHVAPPDGQRHTYDTPIRGVTVAYHRDRGEDLHIEQGATAQKVANQIDADPYCVYIWDGSQWTTLAGEPLAPMVAELKARGEHTWD